MSDAAAGVPARKKFLDETRDAWATFSQQLLTQVPELETVTLVLGWSDLAASLPAGIAATRSGGINSPGQTYITIIQLATILRQLSALNQNQLTELTKSWNALQAATTDGRPKT